MFVVTPSAKQKLQEAIQNYSSGPGLAIRLSLSHGLPNEINLAFDKQQAGDFVVRSRTGRKIMLIAPELYSTLDGMVFDYSLSAKSEGFVLFPRSSTNGKSKP